MLGGGTHAHCEPDKGTLARLGIRNFKPTLRKAAASASLPEAASWRRAVRKPPAS